MTRLLFSLLILLAVMGLAHADSAGPPTQSTSAVVTLQIDQYCTINIERNLLMQVTAGDFTDYPIPISDSCFVDIAANFKFVLVCPKTVTLTRTDAGAGGPYYPTATVNLLSQEFHKKLRRELSIFTLDSRNVLPDHQPANRVRQAMD